MKYLLSDWCGVWVHQFFPRYTAKTRSLMVEWGAEIDIGDYRDFMKSLERDYLRGVISSSKFWDSAMKHYDVSPSPLRTKLLGDAFLAAFAPNDEFVAWVGDNKAGLNIGILSNTYAEVKPLIMNYSAMFDFDVLSCDTGALKPEEESYEAAYQGFLGLNPEILKSEILFIDDKQRNVDAAISYGFRASLYSSPQSLEESLQNM